MQIMNDWLPTRTRRTENLHEGRVRLLLRPREAASALGICEKTLWSITAPRGDLACVRIGRSVRYDPLDLRAWIDRQKMVTAD